MQRDFLPVILGSDENAYGMARAFHERYNIVAAVLCMQVLVPSRYSKIMDIVRVDGLDGEQIFRDSIEKIAREKLKEYGKLILAPCSDRYIELAVNNQDIVGEYFCNRFISPELLQKFVTKEKFYETCDEHGLAYPQTVTCGKQERLSILDRLPFGFPLAVKADNSNGYAYLHSKFEGKQKFYFVNTREDYINIISRMNASDYSDKLVIQEFIPGDDTQMRVLNCFSDNAGRVRLMSLAQPAIEEYTPLNMGNYAALLPDYNEGIFATVKKFLEDIKYTGFSNFDMKFDPKSGEYKLFEINPRQGRSSFFVTASGYNLAEFLVDNCVYEKSSDIVYARGDLMWLTVPKKIIYNYVDNPEVLARADKLLKEKKYEYTLLYKKDMGLRRFLRVKHYYNRHIADYKKYFFRKN